MKISDKATTVSEIRFGGFRLSIHHHIDFLPSIWFASSTGLFERYQLRHKDINEAKKEAIILFRDVLIDALSDTDSLVDRPEAEKPHLKR